MSKDLDTLLTALYVFIDDCVMTPRSGRGRRPELSDSELICLAVAQALLGFHSERRWVRHLHSNPAWRAMFPYLPQQSGYHKRLKAARSLLCRTIVALAAACPSWFDDMWMTDATPVPCGASRETVNVPTSLVTPVMATAPAGDGVAVVSGRSDGRLHCGGQELGVCEMLG